MVHAASLRSLLGPACVLGFALSHAAGNGGPFYELQVAARQGDVIAGESITSIDPALSVNDLGEVAFVAAMSGPGGAGQGIVTAVPAPGGGAPLLTKISFPALNTRQYSFLQINNDGQVVARDRIDQQSLIRTWDRANPGNSVILASTTSTTFGFVSLPARAEDGGVVFIGFEDDNALYLNSSGFRDDHVFLGSLAGGGFRPAAANGGVAVIRNGSGTTGDVIRYAPGPTVLSAGFASTGRAPGVSADGRAVAFVGNGPPNNRDGIYLALFDAAAPGLAAAAKIIDTGDSISFDAAANPITFASFDFDSRVGVEIQPAGVAGIADDHVILTFVATPSSASRANPGAAGTPLLFTAGKGIWSLRVRVESELGSAPLVLAANPSGVLPVVQVGDLVGGQAVTDLQLYDPIGRATANLQGVARVPGPDDHQIAFWADSAAGHLAAVATLADTDSDGLPDHWERAGGGIDIDRDDTVDLSLSAWGATPNHRDFFLELDWLNPRAAGVPVAWSVAPAPMVTSLLATMFANAPLANPDGTMGIRLHLDAGPGVDALNQPFSQSTGTGSLQGGDAIALAAGAHPDLIYFGAPGSVAIPAGLNALAMDQAKDAWFGTADKRARELAFRYCVLTDFSSFLGGAPFVAGASAATANTLTSAVALPAAATPGHCLKILSGPGAGQLRGIQSVAGNVITVNAPWAGGQTPTAASQFVLLNGSSGLGEVYFRPNPNFRSLPGNDFLVSLGCFGVNAGGWLANTCIQWRTLAHEMGHTLGLRHGGTDHNSMKGNAYLSLMSYSFQLQVPSAVQSYSIAGDPTFDDWTAIQPGFGPALFQVGNTYRLAPGAAFDPEEDFTVADFETLNNAPVDLLPPVVEIEAPAAGAPLSGPIDVRLRISDDQVLGGALVRFDLDGDGDSEDPGETRPATAAGGDLFTASFPAPSGALASRTLQAEAHDVSMNIGLASVALGEGGGPGSDLEDNDNDGFVNLLEEALGMDPERPDAGASPVTVRHDPAGAGRVVLTYPRDTAQTDLAYRTEASADLLTWSTEGITETVVRTEGAVEWIEASVPAGPLRIRFLRLAVTRLP